MSLKLLELCNFVKMYSHYTFHFLYYIIAYQISINIAYKNNKEGGLLTEENFSFKHKMEFLIQSIKEE